MYVTCHLEHNHPSVLYYINICYIYLTCLEGFHYVHNKKSTYIKDTCFLFPQAHSRKLRYKNM